MPPQSGTGSHSIYDKHIDFVANHGEKESEIIDQKQTDENNRKLAQRILDLNPDLPPAFRAKFAVMAENSHFSRNVSLVINDVFKSGIKLKMIEKSV